MLGSQRGVGVSSKGVAVVLGALISLLAYTYWLDLSRRQIVIRELQAVA